MANLTTIPLQDAFKTSLAQSWDGEIGTVFLSKSPSFTFPAGNTTYIVVQPNGANPKIAEIDSYNAGANTVNVTNITLETGAGINNPTGVVYPSNTEVIISDNYQFWSDIQTSINSKVNTETGEVEAYADETARDTAIPTPVNGMQVYVTSLGAFTDYQGGFWGVRATGTAIPNAEEGVAGKVELPTDAEVTAGTAIGGTGATLTPTNAQTFKSISLKASTTTIEETDEFVINNAGEDKRVLTSDLRTELGATEVLEGTVRRATDAEATGFTDIATYIPPSKMKSTINTALYGTDTEWDKVFDIYPEQFGTLTNTITVTTGIYNQLNSTGTTSYITSSLASSPTTSSMVWNNFEIMELEFSARSAPGQSSYKIGIVDSTVPLYTTGSTVDKVIMEFDTSTSVSLRTADGTTETVSANSPIINGSWNDYRLRFDQGLSEATLYINGVLVATNTTNLPTSVDTVKIGIGTDTTSNELDTTPISYRVKYT